MVLNRPVNKEFFLKNKKAIALEGVIILLLMVHLLLFFMPIKEKKEKKTKTIQQENIVKIVKKNANIKTLSKETKISIQGLTFSERDNKLFILYKNAIIDPSVFGFKNFDIKELSIPLNEESIKSLNILKEKLKKL